VHLTQRAFSGLNHGDAVLAVSRALLQAADERPHLLADRQAGRVIGGPVDALAAGQLLQRLAQLAARDREVSLRVNRHDVGVDDHCHGR